MVVQRQSSGRKSLLLTCRWMVVIRPVAMVQGHVSVRDSQPSAYAAGTRSRAGRWSRTTTSRSTTPSSALKIGVASPLTAPIRVFPGRALDDLAAVLGHGNRQAAVRLRWMAGGPPPADPPTTGTRASGAAKSGRRIEFEAVTGGRRRTCSARRGCRGCHDHLRQQPLIHRPLGPPDKLGFFTGVRT